MGLRSRRHFYAPIRKVFRGQSHFAERTCEAAPLFVPPCAFGILTGDGALSAGGDAFAEWRSSQPEAAMQWLDKLPPNDKRREAFFKSAIQSLAWHPQAAEQFAALSAPDRATARGVLDTMSSLPADRRTRLLEAFR